MITDPSCFKPGTFLRHRYGGVDMFLSVEGEDMVYRHMWPFEEKDYRKPLLECEGRFMAITTDAVADLMLADRSAMMAEIGRNKQDKVYVF